MSASNYVLLSLEQKAAELETRLAAAEQRNSDLMIQLVKLSEEVHDMQALKKDTTVKDKQEYRNDEWCHSVIEGEERSCGVRLFQEKDGRIAELTSERDALLRDVHWLTMDKEGLREGAEELKSKIAGLEHASVEYIGTITDLGRKLGEANQREKKLRERITHLEGILLAIKLPQGQAYPATAPKAKP